MSFHRNKGTELGLIPQTRKYLENPPMPFEAEKHDRICSDLFKERTYAQRYYAEVYKPRQAALKAEKEAAKLAEMDKKKVVKLRPPQTSTRKVTNHTW